MFLQKPLHDYEEVTQNIYCLLKIGGGFFIPCISNKSPEWTYG